MSLNTDVKFSPLDPFAYDALLALPTYSIGKKVIDQGAQAVEIYTEHVSRIHHVAALNEYVLSYLQTEGVNAQMRTGDMPGALSFIVITPNNNDYQFIARVLPEHNEALYNYQCYLVDNLGIALCTEEMVHANEASEVAEMLLKVYNEQVRSSTTM